MLRFVWFLAWLPLIACGGARSAPNSVRAEVAAIDGSGSPLQRALPAPIGATNVERVKLRWEALPGGFARAVAVSSGLDRVAFGSDSGTLLYELGTGKPAGKLGACADMVRSGMFFYRSHLWVVCREGVQRFDPLERRKLEPLEVDTAPITAAAFSDSRLALAHRDGVIRVHDLESHERFEVVVPGPPIDVKSLALDAAGKRVAVAWIQGSIWWWDLAEPQTYHKLVRYEHESDSLSFAPNGLLAEEGRTGFTSLWRFGAQGEAEKAAEIVNGDWIKRLGFTHDSTWLVRGGSDGLDLAEALGRKRIELDARGKVEDVAMDEAGSVIVSGDRVGRLLTFAVTR